MDNIDEDKLTKAQLQIFDSTFLHNNSNAMHIAYVAT